MTDDDDGAPFTRRDYLAANGADRDASWDAHRRFYAQFVTRATVQWISAAAGIDRLCASTDRALNDVHDLDWWDQASQQMPYRGTRADWARLGDHPSLAGAVCIAKEAARQAIEIATGARDA